MQLYIGNYFDGEGENYLIFVAPKTCNREEEFKKYFFSKYDVELEDEDIEGVYPLGCGVNDNYGNTWKVNLELVSTKKEQEIAKYSPEAEHWKTL